MSDDDYDALQRAVDAERMRIRRKRLTDAKLCLNGESHGPSTHGVRCQWCYGVHKFGAAVAVFRGYERPVKAPGRGRRSA
jgi:hypothetical protein